MPPDPPVWACFACHVCFAHNLPIPYRTCRGTYQLPIGPGIISSLVMPLDFCKAFDEVLHARLFCKLNYYGIHGSYSRNFLLIESSKSFIDNKSSTASTVISGIPQGSLLGPLLFQLFLNDLPRNIDSLVKLYADDALIMRSIITPNNHQTLQNYLTNLALLSATWQMPFNLTKCGHLIVTNKPHPSTYHNDYIIQKVGSIKYLGLMISHINLSWLPLGMQQYYNIPIYIGLGGINNTFLRYTLIINTSV